MSLDSRSWSMFIFLTTCALLLASVSTPYYIKGVTVQFGQFGLWSVDVQQPGARSMGYYTVTQVLLVVAVACAALTLVGYLLLFKYGVTMTSQAITLVAQFLTGVFTMTAVSLFALNDNVLAEGWWMSTMAGLLYLFNTVVIVFLPIMEYDRQKL